MSDQRIDLYAPPKSFKMPSWLGGTLALAFTGMIVGSGYLFIRVNHPSVLTAIAAKLKPTPHDTSANRDIVEREAPVAAVASPANLESVKLAQAGAVVNAPSAPAVTETAEAPVATRASHGNHRRHLLAKHKRPAKGAHVLAANTKHGNGHDTRSSKKNRDEIDRLLGM